MPALLPIDFQHAFDHPDHWGTERSDPEAERHAASLLASFRSMTLPIVHVRHDSLLPDSPLHREEPGFVFKSGFEPAPGERCIVKHENGAFSGTPLDTHLRRLGIDRLMVAGLTTPNCVSTSVRQAAIDGFDVTLAGDACASFDAVGPDGRRIDAGTVQAVSLATLHGEFCAVRTVEAIVEAILSTGSLKRTVPG